MNRLTRRVIPRNSFELHRFLTETTLRRLRNPLFLTSGRPCSNHKLTSSVNPVGRRIADRHRLVMDSHPGVGEDYVHIEVPENSSVESSCESVVGVAEDSWHDDVGVGSEEKEQRRILPEELSRSVVVLTCESVAEGGTCVVHLVGTAHVSEESCREVQEVIKFLKPQVVFLELCSSRVAVLTSQSLKVPTVGEMAETWTKKHNPFGILYSWFLAKVASKLEVLPGSEFRVAFEEARKYGGKVILGDRPVNITLQRIWGKMPLRDKAKLLYSILFQALFLPSPQVITKTLKEMDDANMLTLVNQEMSKEFPTLMETLLHERDQYMSSKLLTVAGEHSSVVAVVGKGHLQGIQEYWKQPVEMENLLEIPSKKPSIPTLKIILSLGIAIAGVAIVSGTYLSGKK